MQCLNDLDALLLDTPRVRKGDARFAADFEIKFAKTRCAIADTLRELTAERDALAAELARVRGELAQTQPLQLADWNRAPKWAEWHAIDADGKGHWFQKRPAMTADYWCSESDGDSTFDAWYALGTPEDWRRTSDERPLPF